MGLGDFLKKDAETPLEANYLAAGQRCVISTNFAPIQDAARASFLRLEEPSPRPDLRLRFWVDFQSHLRPPWPKPHFRGLDHLVFAGLDEGDSFLMDLRRRCAIGRFTRGRAEDLETWTGVVFPTVLSVLGPVVGITNLHCACLVQEGCGILLAGPAGAGKSTLALALARCGWGLLSDDRTYISRQDGHLRAWGLPGPLKLLPDGPAFFPELSDLTPQIALNGEPALVFDAERRLGVERTLRCVPRWLFFLDRQDHATFSLRELAPSEALERLQEDLPEDLPGVVEHRQDDLRLLVRGSCWLLRYGGSPHAIAQALAEFCANAFEPGLAEEHKDGDRRLA